jgi:excisionase family DNA binding protein
MEQLQVTQYSGEELQRKFKVLEEKLDDIKNNFEPKTPIEYLTRNEVAEMLKIDLSSVHNWTKKRILQAYQCGGRVYYKRKEVEEAIIKLKK